MLKFYSDIISQTLVLNLNSFTFLNSKEVPWKQTQSRKLYVHRVVANTIQLD